MLPTWVGRWKGKKMCSEERVCEGEEMRFQEFAELVLRVLNRKSHGQRLGKVRQWVAHIGGYECLLCAQNVHSSGKWVASVKGKERQAGMRGRHRQWVNQGAPGCQGQLYTKRLQRCEAKERELTTIEEGDRNQGKSNNAIYRKIGSQGGR